MHYPRQNVLLKSLLGWESIWCRSTIAFVINYNVNAHVQLELSKTVIVKTCLLGMMIGKQARTLNHGVVSVIILVPLPMSSLGLVLM